MSSPQSLAQGAPLNAASWADFVQRLHHDIKGDGVRNHCTADAVFQVLYAVERVIPEGYGGVPVIFDGESSSSVEEFVASLDEDTLNCLNEDCDGDFATACDSSREEALRRNLTNHSLLYVETRWEVLNQHFTYAAADAFIQRKKHDYPKGLRVYVDASTYCWELNTIKEAILNGQLQFVAPAAPV